MKIRHEAIKQDQDLSYEARGLCVLKGEYVLILDSGGAARKRVMTLATALKHFELQKVYIRPVVRELLDRIPEQRPFSISWS